MAFCWKNDVLLIPTMATSFLYYTVLAQMLTFSVGQSETLDRRLGPYFVMPPTVVGVFLHLTVLVAIPLYEVVVKPVLRHLTSHETGISVLQRIGVGLVFSVLAMITAALVEQKRLLIIRHLNFEDHPGVMLPMSVFWLMPQYFLVGLGEVFAYIGHMEFFYTEAPKTMRTIGTGFFLFTLAMGYFASSLIVYLVGSFSTQWLHSKNINTSRLDKFYWLMAGIGGVNVVLYVLVSRNYTYTSERYTRELYSKGWKLLEHRKKLLSSWASSPMSGVSNSSPMELRLQMQRIEQQQQPSTEEDPGQRQVIKCSSALLVPNESFSSTRRQDVTGVDSTREEATPVARELDAHHHDGQP